MILGSSSRDGSWFLRDGLSTCLAASKMTLDSRGRSFNKWVEVGRGSDSD